MCQEVFLRHWDTEFHVNLENMSASNFIPFSRAISSGNLPDLSWIWRASIDPGWSSRYVASWENPRRAERWSNVSWPGDDEIDGKSYKLLVQQSKKEYTFPWSCSRKSPLQEQLLSLTWNRLQKQFACISQTPLVHYTSLLNLLWTQHTSHACHAEITKNIIDMVSG